MNITMRTNNIERWHYNIENALHRMREACPNQDMIIAIEGNDYSGKTTFIKDYMKHVDDDEYDIVLKKFPSDETRKLIKDDMSYVEMLRFQSSALMEMLNFLGDIKGKDTNTLYILDRFYLSAIAYYMYAYDAHEELRATVLPSDEDEVSELESSIELMIGNIDSTHVHDHCLNIILLINNELLEARMEKRGIENALDQSAVKRNQQLNSTFLEYKQDKDLEVISADKWDDVLIAPTMFNVNEWFPLIEKQLCDPDMNFKFVSFDGIDRNGMTSVIHQVEDCISNSTKFDHSIDVETIEFNPTNTQAMIDFVDTIKSSKKKLYLIDKFLMSSLVHYLVKRYKSYTSISATDSWKIVEELGNENNIRSELMEKALETYRNTEDLGIKLLIAHHPSPTDKEFFELNDFVNNMLRQYQTIDEDNKEYIIVT